MSTTPDPFDAFAPDGDTTRMALGTEVFIHKELYSDAASRTYLATPIRIGTDKTPVLLRFLTFSSSDDTAAAAAAKQQFADVLTCHMDSLSGSGSNDKKTFANLLNVTRLALDETDAKKGGLDAKRDTVLCMLGEFVPGRSLRGLLMEQEHEAASALPAAAAQRYFFQILQGVALLHDKGHAHGSISSESVIVDCTSDSARFEDVGYCNKALQAASAGAGAASSTNVEQQEQDVRACIAVLDEMFAATAEHREQRALPFLAEQLGRKLAEDDNSKFADGAPFPTAQQLLADAAWLRDAATVGPTSAPVPLSIAQKIADDTRKAEQEAAEATEALKRYDEWKQQQQQQQQQPASQPDPVVDTSAAAAAAPTTSAPPSPDVFWKGECTLGKHTFVQLELLADGSCELKYRGVDDPVTDEREDGVKRGRYTQPDASTLSITFTSKQVIKPRFLPEAEISEEEDAFFTGEQQGDQKVILSLGAWMLKKVSGGSSNNNSPTVAPAPMAAAAAAAPVPAAATPQAAGTWRRGMPAPPPSFPTIRNSTNNAPRVWHGRYIDTTDPCYGGTVTLFADDEMEIVSWDKSGAYTLQTGAFFVGAGSSSGGGLGGGQVDADLPQGGTALDIYRQQVFAADSAAAAPVEYKQERLEGLWETNHATGSEMLVLQPHGTMPGVVGARTAYAFVDKAPQAEIDAWREKHTNKSPNNNNGSSNSIPGVPNNSFAPGGGGGGASAFAPPRSDSQMGFQRRAHSQDRDDDDTTAAAAATGGGGGEKEPEFYLIKPHELEELLAQVRDHQLQFRVRTAVVARHYDAEKYAAQQRFEQSTVAPYSYAPDNSSNNNSVSLAQQLQQNQQQQPPSPGSFLVCSINLMSDERYQHTMHGGGVDWSVRLAKMVETLSIFLGAQGGATAASPSPRQRPDFFCFQEWNASNHALRPVEDLLRHQGFHLIVAGPGSAETVAIAYNSRRFTTVGHHSWTDQFPSRMSAPHVASFGTLVQLFESKATGSRVAVCSVRLPNEPDGRNRHHALNGAHSAAVKTCATGTFVMAGDLGLTATGPQGDAQAVAQAFPQWADVSSAVRCTACPAARGAAVKSDYVLFRSPNQSVLPAVPASGAASAVYTVPQEPARPMAERGAAGAMAADAFFSDHTALFANFEFHNFAGAPPQVV